jgi:hypothetical protein
MILQDREEGESTPLLLVGVEEADIYSPKDLRGPSFPAAPVTPPTLGRRQRWVGRSEEALSSVRHHLDPLLAQILRSALLPRPRKWGAGLQYGLVAGLALGQPMLPRRTGDIRELPRLLLAAILGESMA